MPIDLQLRCHIDFLVLYIIIQFIEQGPYYITANT
jgi:hypothetical protein